MPKIRYESDKDRDKQTYRYLFQICGFEKGTFPNSQDLFDMWIQKQKDSKEKDRERKFISRLLESSEKKTDPPELSLYRLVEILTSIDEYFDRKKECDMNKQPKILTSQEKLRAIRKYCELTKDEKRQLKLPIDFQSFIQENIKTCMGDEKESDLMQNQGLDLFILPSKNNGYKTIKVDDEKLKELVRQIILDILDETQKEETWVADNEEYLEFIIKKIKNQIDSIKVQSGLQNISAINESLQGCQGKFKNSLSQPLETILADKSIKQLTRNILTNTRLTAKFPIELRNIEVNNIEYLPLENADDNDLINENLLEYDNNSEDIRAVISSFKSRKTYSVKIHFRLRVKKDQKDKSIDFFEEVIGTSSILSLVRKALNRALLWDIPCLREYFPVAQEVNLEDNIFAGDTLAIVRSKSRLRLVKLQDIQELINEEDLREILHSGENTDQRESCFITDFDSYVEGTDICQGDFSGFDLIESIAKSGFFARLKILNELNIDSKKYITQLKKRIQEKDDLGQGKQYLHSYPFSLLAMEHHFKKTILQENYRDNVLTLKKERLTNIAYQAILTVIQGYLTEGLYKQAETKLQTLDSHLQYFTHFLRADYYLCKAEYTLLSEDQNKSSPDSLIKECTDYLRKAKNELLLRVLEFFRIGEISQGNLSPLFTHWARIYAFEARLSLFFPRFFKDSSSISELFQPLTLFGNARINAARDGDSFLSFQMALYQSWCYLIQAYIGDERKGFGKKDCLEWAKKLLDFALIGYKKDSHEKYQDYMQAVFAEYDNNDYVNYEEYGDNLKIQRPPFIRLFNEYKPSEEQTGLDCNISSSLIKRKLLNSWHNDNSDNNSSEKKTIDLFGQYSGLYFYGCSKL